MFPLFRFLTLLLAVVAFGGCDRAQQPDPPPSAQAAEPPDDVESLELFLSRKVRSARLLSLNDRDGGPSFAADGPNPLTFEWTFGPSEFEIKSTDGDLPKLITNMILSDDQPATQIQGSWKLQMRGGAYGLLLKDVKSDRGASKAAVPLNLYHTSPSVIFVSGDTVAELMFQVDSDPGDV